MRSSTPRSAGVLMYRIDGGELRVLLGHPGGPFWRNRQHGAWSIPKGLVEVGEDERSAALREFSEETGKSLDGVSLVSLGEIRQRSGKTVVAWACQGEIDVADLTSNLVRLEWPRGSGIFIEFPEIDEIRWCSREEARLLVNPAQVAFLDRLEELLDHAK